MENITVKLGALPLGLAFLLVLLLSTPAHTQTRERTVTSSLTSSRATPLEFNRVRLAQAILAHEGYAIGAIDGAWGGKTQTAVSVERSLAGLSASKSLSPASRQVLFTKPAARRLGGLPEAGEALFDLDQRRAFLQDNPAIAEAYCRADYDQTGLSSRSPRVVVIGPHGLHEGKVADDLPWYQSVAQSYSAENDACLMGQDQACQRIIDNLQLFVDVWGLRPSIERTDAAFEPLAAQANMALNAMLNAYITAQHFLDVPPRQQERITDFLFGRVTMYKRVVRRDEGLADRFRFGHSAAQLSVLPVLTVGAMVGDPQTFYEGLDLYEFALDNTRVDGSIREDSLTGDMALMQETALLSAMLVAGLRAQQQDVDLASLSRLGRDIHDLAATVVTHLEDWDRLLPYAMARQPSFLTASRLSEEPTSLYTRDLDHLLSWTVLYSEIFPESRLTQRLARLELDPRTCGRLAERHQKAPWTCYRALSELSTHASVILPSPQGSLFIGFNPGCLIARSPSPFSER